MWSKQLSMGQSSWYISPTPYFIFLVFTYHFSKKGDLIFFKVFKFASFPDAHLAKFRNSSFSVFSGRNKSALNTLAAEMEMSACTE